MTSDKNEPILLALLGAQKQAALVLEAALAQDSSDSIDHSDPAILALLGVASIKRKLDRWIADLSETPTTDPPMWDDDTRLFR